MSRRVEPTNTTPSDPEDFEKRLNAKLEARRLKEAKEQAPPQGWALGLRYGSEFIGGIFVGTGIGFFVDWLLQSAPWGMLIGVLLGFAAGTLNVVRAAREMNSAGDGGAESRQEPPQH